MRYHHSLMPARDKKKKNIYIYIYIPAQIIQIPTALHINTYVNTFYIERQCITLPSNLHD